MGLQVWLPLNGDLHNQGLSPITTSGTAVYGNGKIAFKALSLTDSSSVFVNCPRLNGAVEFSIAFWIIGNVDSNDETWASPISLQTNKSGTVNYDFRFGKNNSTTGYPLTVFNNLGYTIISKNSIDTTTSDDYGKWFHFCFTTDGTTVKTYKNGTLVASQNIGVGGFLTGMMYLRNHIRYNGYLNDFRIYDNCLSPREIKEISKGLVLHYPLSRGGFGGDNIISGTSPNEIQYTYPSFGFSDKFSSITTIVPTASQYTLSFWAKSTINGDKVTAHYYSPNTTTTCVSSQGISKTASDGNMPFTLSTEWEYYWVTYTQTETTEVKHVIFPRMGAAIDNPYNIPSGSGVVSIKCVKFEEGDIPTPWTPAPSDDLYSQMGLDNNIEYDVSGYGNNGTRVGTFSWSGDTPRYGCSTIFNGADNAIQTPNLTTMITDKNYTISCWTYKTTIGTKNYQTIYGGPSGFELEARSSSNTNPLFMLCNWGGGTTPYVFGEWTHFCFVHTDSDSKLYVNGELKITGSSVNIPSGNYYIGAWSVATSQNYDGLMSDFRIYATALSADDVMALYHTPISLANNGTLLTQGEYVES